MSEEYIKLITPVFRVNYPNVFTARAQRDGQEPKFGLMAMWTPAEFSDVDKKRWKELKAAMNAESKKAFGKLMKDLPRTYKLGLRDGAEKEEIEGLGEGTVFANLTSKRAPGVVGPAPEKLDISLEEGNEDEFYPGCYARATVNIYTYNNEGKGIALGLNNLMKVKDGELIVLGSAGNAKDDFADEMDDADGAGEEDTGFLD